MDYALEILKDELKEIHEMQQNLLEATDEITFEKRRISLEEAIMKVENHVVLADVIVPKGTVCGCGTDEICGICYKSKGYVMKGRTLHKQTAL